ncbi:MAG TPA: hypothetical protein VNC18_09755 [Gemmatimonadaceae bacterium]|nr:hypothetical protein [Gemmatimonadaceae bacterium]
MNWNVREQIDRDTLKRDPRYDPSGPPPPPPAPKLSKHPTGEFIRSHLGKLTLKDLAYLAGLVLTALTWAQSRASRDDVETAKRQCMDSAAAAIASALAPVPPRLKAIDRKLSRNDQRWDRLDAWHVRAFAVPNRTPPPKFGPTAERRGEARYEDEDDE